MEAAKPTKLRPLTKKQRGFVNDTADGVPGVKAVLNHYDTEDYNTAAVIASENLNKPNIQEELRKLGFDSNNAKRVISNILNDETVDPKDRIKAAENVFKVNGDYAPEKNVNINVEVEATDEIKEAAELLNEHFRNCVTGNGIEAIPVGTQTQDKE